MTAALLLTTAGFALIAVCYGLARFAFGLFLPAISAEFNISASLAGLISGGSFLSYCLAIFLSSWLSERFGPRLVTVVAAGIAASGLAGVAAATGPFVLAASVLFAGLSSGLVSPPLAAAVSMVVKPEGRPAANTVINAGTSAGLALSGPIAIALGAEWRFAYALFAGIAIVAAIAAVVFVPGTGSRHPSGGVAPIRFTADIRRLVVVAFLCGVSSTAVWSFGGELTVHHLGWPVRGVAFLWIVIGVAGLAGGAAGGLVNRFGIAPVHLGFSLVMAVAILLVGHVATTTPLALMGGLFFGCAYVSLSGVYLVWGVSALPERPAMGLAIAFFTLAPGQTCGAPVFGYLYDAASPLWAVIGFAAIGVVVGMAGLRREPLGAVCAAE